MIVGLFSVFPPLNMPAYKGMPRLLGGLLGHCRHWLNPHPPVCFMWGRQQERAHPNPQTRHEEKFPTSHFTRLKVKNHITFHPIILSPICRLSRNWER